MCIIILFNYMSTYTVEPRSKTTPARKGPIYSIVDTSFGPKCIYIQLCTIKTPEMQNPLHSVKQACSPVQTVPELCTIHLIIWTLDRLLLCNFFATFGGLY